LLLKALSQQLSHTPSVKQEFTTLREQGCH
jgi:hypothetical protein